MLLARAADLDTLLDAVGARHPAVAAHGRRVAAYAVRLATQFGLAPQAVDAIRTGALLHDIGKIHLPADILLKPGRLTDHEWTEVQTHPEIGYALVDGMGLAPAARDIVLCHHERHDGTGYPLRLSGSSLDWAVRLVSVADAFDALTSHRPYRAAVSIDVARSVLAREAGSRFCPWAVSALLSLPRELLKPAAHDRGISYQLDGCPPQAAAFATRTWQAAPVH